MLKDRSIRGVENHVRLKIYNQGCCLIRGEITRCVKMDGYEVSM